MTLFQAVLMLAAFLCSLVAGLLFAFAAVVMPGIRRLGTRPLAMTQDILPSSLRHNVHRHHLHHHHHQDDGMNYKEFSLLIVRSFSGRRTLEELGPGFEDLLRRMETM